MKITFTVGCFDMFHEGHANLIKKMSDSGGRLVIFVHDDSSIFENKGRFPVQSFEQRVHNVLYFGTMFDIPIHVEEVATADPSLAIKLFIERNVSNGNDLTYMRGNDWENFPGKGTLKLYSIPIEFIPYTEGVSSSKLRDEISGKHGA